MSKFNMFAVLGILFLSSILLANGMYSNNVAVLAQHENVKDLNEAEVNADIEQENKCKKDTECENENELNNQLSITNITQIQTQTVESQTTLNVIKIVRCEELGDEGQEIECPGGIVPEAFTMIVSGNNPSPSQFPGSEQGTLVTIGAGPYTVSETADGLGLLSDFSGDCIQTGPHTGEGTIAEGEEQTCAVTNTFLIDDP